MKAESPMLGILLCGWFALVAVAFWAPYFGPGLVLPSGPLNALYAVFLLISLATLALRLLRQGPDGSPKEDAPRRGR